MSRPTGGLFDNLVRGHGDSAAATRAFYKEYSSVMDLPADFYLHTIKRVFHDQTCHAGRFRVRGEPVEPAAIEHTALMTVEGERDDVCGPGQTVAAHELCSGVIPAKRATTSSFKSGILECSMAADGRPRPTRRSASLSGRTAKAHF